MLYLLLTIIAIGVLLASKAGQNFLIILILLAVALGLSSLATIFLAGSLSFLYENKSQIYNSYQKFGIIIPTSLLCYGLYGLYEKSKKERLGIIFLRLLKRIFPQEEKFEEHKIAITFLILAFVFIIGVIIYNIFF